MKIALSADLHQASRIWSEVPQSTGLPIQAFKDLLTQCKEAKVDAVLVAGDVFDSKKPSPGAVRNIQKTLSKNSPPFIAIYGNHDKPPVGESPWHECVGMCSFDNIGDQLGLKIAHLNYTKNTEGLQDTLKDIRDNLKGPLDLLVLHSPFRHLLSFDDSWQLQAKDVKGIAKVVLVGDVHTPDVYTRMKDTTIVSPGSIYPLSINKIGKPHGWYLWDVEEGTFDFKRLPDIMTKVHSLQEAREALQEGVDHLICVVVPKEEEGAVKELDASTDTPVAFFSKTLEGPAYKEELPNLEGSLTISLVSALPLAVDRKKEPEVFNKLSRDLGDIHV